jgi:hypothetical protein
LRRDRMAVLLCSDPAVGPPAPASCWWASGGRAHQPMGPCCSTPLHSASPGGAWCKAIAASGQPRQPLLLLWHPVSPRHHQPPAPPAPGTTSPRTPPPL